jgi:hypothetical protein
MLKLSLFDDECLYAKELVEILFLCLVIGARGSKLNYSFFDYSFCNLTSGIISISSALILLRSYVAPLVVINGLIYASWKVNAESMLLLTNILKGLFSYSNLLLAIIFYDNSLCYSLSISSFNSVFIFILCFL